MTKHWWALSKIVIVKNVEWGNIAPTDLRSQEETRVKDDPLSLALSWISMSLAWSWSAIVFLSCQQKWVNKSAAWKKDSKKTEIWGKNRKFGDENFHEASNNKPVGCVTNTLGEAEGNLSWMEEVLLTFFSGPACVRLFQVIHSYLPGNLWITHLTFDLVQGVWVRLLPAAELGAPGRA